MGHGQLWSNVAEMQPASHLGIGREGVRLEDHNLAARHRAEVGHLVGSRAGTAQPQAGAGGERLGAGRAREGGGVRSGSDR